MAKTKQDIGGADHWEKKYNPTPNPHEDPNGQWMRNWDPKHGKDRPQPHNKINELDHWKLQGGANRLIVNKHISGKRDATQITP